MLITKKKPQTFDHKQPQQEIFNHDPAGQLVKIQKHFTLIGESIDIVKENIVETLYQDYVSVANQIFNHQMNFLVELRPGLLELKNITAITNDFLTISFDYSLAKTLDNEVL